MAYLEVYLSAKKLLVMIGFWPVEKVPSITKFLLSIFIIFTILAIIKNLINFDRGAATDAFTNVNGGLLCLYYFIILITRRDKFQKLFNFVDEDVKRLLNDEEIEPMNNAELELRKILRVAVYIFPLAVIVKFIQPFMTILYIRVFTPGQIFEFPPTMFIPNFLLGNVGTYIIETSFRSIMLICIMGTLIAFMISTLYICSQFSGLCRTLKSGKAPGTLIITNRSTTLNISIQRHSILLE